MHLSSSVTVEKTERTSNKISSIPDSILQSVRSKNSKSKKIKDKSPVKHNSSMEDQLSSKPVNKRKAGFFRAVTHNSHSFSKTHYTEKIGKSPKNIWAGRSSIQD